MIHGLACPDPLRKLSQTLYTRLHEVTRDNVSSPLLHPEGVAVTSPKSVAAAKKASGWRTQARLLDGIHTSFNRWPGRPIVRLHSHTCITGIITRF
jgi:hypothetical protein